MENRFYTIDQVAEILDIHHKTVRKFIKEGKLKANKLGKQWRISQMDLDSFTQEKNTLDENEEFAYDEELEFSNSKISMNENNNIRVSSVVDLEQIDIEEYSRISNMLLAIMNCQHERSKNQTINMRYSKNVHRLRIMIWADIDTTKELLDLIAMLTESKNKGEDKNEV